MHEYNISFFGKHLKGTTYATNIDHALEKGKKMLHGEVKSIEHVRELTNDEAIEYLRRKLMGT